MQKYRKIPVEIEAMKFTRETYDELRTFTDNAASKLTIPRHPDGVAECTVETLNGPVTVTEGEYIIKGVHGEFYPCEESIFKATYEKVE